MNHNHWKWISCICAVLMILGYNTILLQRANAEEIAQLTYQLEQLQGQSGEDSFVQTVFYQDGVFETSAQGYGGEIIVQTTVENGTIIDLQVISAAQEDALYLTLAKSVLNQILQTQSTQVDTVSGATYSSAGIIEAVNQALTVTEE